ncbi:class I SAM-dependent methyltransferase [Sungkyunkwania multivorans]|uniref:Class I SAM-dependent methyltransferase n=1 Tax=Sungkyunkwania multivorans TaxID=1173618 RepID=A0ABW3CWA8_9FLAO
MKPLKDLFSEAAADYKKYRPNYPKLFFEELLALVDEKDRCWDCGTGNGQVAAILSPYFHEVKASDISVDQIENAITKKNIEYHIARAEATVFPDDSFDLITVAQAIHWFDFAAFYNEVKRVMKPKAILAVFGYGLIRGTSDFNDLIDHFYAEMTPYWAPERRYVEMAYETIPFPFEEHRLNNEYQIDVHWTLEQLVGYLSSWSAVKHYRERHQSDAVTNFGERLTDLYQHRGTLPLKFPIFYRIGRSS